MLSCLFCRFSSFWMSFPRKLESILSFLNLAERETNKLDSCSRIPPKNLTGRNDIQSDSDARRLCCFSSFWVSFPRKRESILFFSLYGCNLSETSCSDCEEPTFYTLYAFNSNGTLKWQFSVVGTANTSPVVAPDGTIYFSTWHN